MKAETIQHLSDIRQACRYLIEFADGRGVEDYQADAYLRSALDRQVQIAGEALNRLRKI